VTEAQGYLFSRPVPEPRLKELLKASHQARPAAAQIAGPRRQIA